MKTNPNEPVNHAQRDSYGESNHGLTKREYFAAMAMQGLCGRESWEDISSCSRTESIAVDAIKYADALIAELNKASES